MPLYIKLPRMNAYAKHFDSNNKYLNLLVLDGELLKNIMEYEIKLKIHLKKNLILS